MGSAVNFQYKHITASAVVAGSSTAGQNTGGPQAVLHTVAVNTAAATAVIAVYDDVTTTTPARLMGSVTAPAGGLSCTFMQFDCEVTTGITVLITVAAADVTVTYR